MVTFSVSSDKKTLILTEASLNSEKSAAYNYFKKKSKDGDFNILVSRGIWDGMDHFMSKKGELPIGLWKELKNFEKAKGIEVQIDGISDVFSQSNGITLEKTSFEEFVIKLFKGILTDKGEPFYPRDYQVEGSFRAIKYKFCCQELATSAGKTSIFYTYNSYLKYQGIIDKNNKSLLIVPNVSLVNQTADAFNQYSNGTVKWNIHKIGGNDNDFDLEKFKECDLLITTYQSLINLIPKCLDKKLETAIKKKRKKDEDEKRKEEINRIKKKILEAKMNNISSYFKVVCVDEAHKSRGDSITDILESCSNWEYKLGLSGTLKLNEEYSDFFKMQQNIGPLVMMLNAKFLIDNDYSPTVKIKQVYLEYSGDHPAVKQYLDIQKNPELREKIKAQFKDPKDFGRNMLEIEKGIIFDSRERMDFLNGLIKRFSKNTLILFSDVKNEYGLNLSKRLKEWNPNTFYIDGSVETQDRQRYKEEMEREEGVIIVASYGTFATGIDLKNVHHIVFAESTKAEITIRQAIGRGMRYLKGKNEVIIWDVIDNLSGYSMKHSEARAKIYKEQNFEILTPKSHSLKIEY
jgi:superfamily II DNA or RNA helicase